MIKKKSETDWAVTLLAENKEALYYRDLLLQIAEKMGRGQDEASLSMIYTRINLDNRLVYQGDGYWFFDTNRIKKEEGK